MFKSISAFGIPLNNEGKANWVDLREKVSKDFGETPMNKNVTEIEKFVDKLRLKCQEIIESASVSKDEPKPTESDDFSDLNLTYEEALQFNKNSEMLYFIRKGILSNKMATFKNGVSELIKNTEDLPQGEPGSVPEGYEVETHDKYIS